MSSQKQILIFGPDASSNERLAGALIWKCGLDNLLVEELGRAGIQHYVDIRQYLKKNGHQPAFRTRNKECTIVDAIHDATHLVLCLSVRNVPSTRQSLQATLAGISRATLDSSKVTIAIDDMQVVGWTQDSLNESITTFRQENQEDFADFLARAEFVPVSGAEGMNILDTPAKVPWLQQATQNGGYTTKTLVQLLDE